ncbi:MAG: FAD binding domain-containing protein [Acidobacteriota bacterium]
MKAFDYAAPASLPEAVGLLASQPAARLLAGGTDLLVQLRSGRKQADVVIDVKKIPELNEITLAPDHSLTIGAAVPCYRLTDHPAIRTHYPALAEVASWIGGTPIQGRASLGGTLCNSAPSADSIPLLIALSASAHLIGPAGRRSVPVEAFCTAPGRNQLAPGELLVAIHIPAPAPHSGAAYLRFSPRNEMDIAVVGAGASLTLADGLIAAARLALSSVAPTPLFVPAAGESLIGQAPTPAALEAAAQLAQAAASPISDMRGSAAYRRHLCAVMARRALELALARAQESK